MAAHASLAQEVGMFPENIYIVKRGDVMVLHEDGFVHEGGIAASDVMIDGNAIGDVGNIVLRDRKVLSEDGIFIVAITVNKKEKKKIEKIYPNKAPKPAAAPKQSAPTPSKVTVKQERAERQTRPVASSKITPMRSSRKANQGPNMEVCVIKPSSMEDTREIAD